MTKTIPGAIRCANCGEWPEQDETLARVYGFGLGCIGCHDGADDKPYYNHVRSNKPAPAIAEWNDAQKNMMLEKLSAFARDVIRSDLFGMAAAVIDDNSHAQGLVHDGQLIAWLREENQ